MIDNNASIEILFIEDNVADAEMTIRTLKRNRVANHIVHLRDGAAALDFIFGTGEFTERNTKNKPKIVLLDLKMPKIDGFEVLKRIKADANTKTIPVIVLTSSKEDPDIKTCYELGANSYIVKPVGFENFAKALSELEMYWLILNQSPS